MLSDTEGRSRGAGEGVTEMAMTRAGFWQGRRTRAALLVVVSAIAASLAVGACGHSIRAGGGLPASSSAGGKARAAAPSVRTTGGGQFSAIDASFASPTIGWLLGVPPCASRQHPCRTLLLRKTTDGGKTWVAAQPPPAPWSTWTDTPASAVRQILFTNSRDGWAWGPGLWSTRDAGATWRRVRVIGGPVQSLAVAGGRVLAATGRCGQADPWHCRFQVYTTRAGSGLWRPIPGARGGPTAPARLVVSGGTGYVVSTTGDLRSVLLSGPVNGSARWRPLGNRNPCPGAFSLALATAGRWLFLGCGFEPGAGNQVKTAYVSASDGRTWRRVASPPFGGYLDAASMTTGGTIMLSGGRMDVYISVNRGRSWYTSPSLNYAAGLAGAGDSLSADATSNTTGYAFQAGVFKHQIWITHDAGRHWTPVTVR